jgi:hypothetical protein
MYFLIKITLHLWKHATTFVPNIYLCTSKLGSGEKAIEVDIGLDECNSLVPLVNRECLLKKILTLLLCMARRRHYNPPPESEIVYYRELKGHIRCVIAYHEAKGRSQGNPVQSLTVECCKPCELIEDVLWWSLWFFCFDMFCWFWRCSFTDVQWEYSKDPSGYHSLSCSQTISAVEELIELTGPLKELVPNFQDLSNRGGEWSLVLLSVNHSSSSKHPYSTARLLNWWDIC